MKTARLAVCILAISLIACMASAQYTNKSTCLDGAGDWSTGGNYTNISAIAQPGGIGVSSGGGMVNYAGFLNTFSLKPNQDTDGDGLDDEADADNDNDGLQDIDEVAGDLFSPGTPTDHNLADTDGDGVGDGDEVAAQTDPTDTNGFLRITSIDRGAGTDKELQWVARSNVTYRIRYENSDMPGRPTQVLGTTTVTTEGTGAWQVATGAYTDNSGESDARFYAVEPVQ